MELVVNLTPELESELSAEAARAGLPLSEYALRLIVSARAATANVHSGAELLNYWRDEGLVGTRTDIGNSQSHARSIRDQAEKRLR